MKRLVCVGDNVVDRYLSLRRMYPGGNAVNVAVGAQRSGVPTSYIGVVGSDQEGQCVIQALKAEGVDIRRVRVVDGPTAFTDVYLTGGERTFGESSIGVSRFHLSDDDMAFIAEFDAVHTGECSLLEDQLPELVQQAPVSFDFSTRPAPYVRALLKYVSFATFSRSQSCDSSCEELLRDTCGRGPHAALVTRGAQGAMLLINDHIYSSEGMPIEATDTLGAGDALIARVLAGYLAGESPQTLLAAGIEKAVAVCRHYGAFGHGGVLWDRRPTAAPMSEG